MWHALPPLKHLIYSCFISLEKEAQNFPSCAFVLLFHDPWCQLRLLVQCKQSDKTGKEDCAISRSLSSTSNLELILDARLHSLWGWQPCSQLCDHQGSHHHFKGWPHIIPQSDTGVHLLRTCWCLISRHCWCSLETLGRTYMGTMWQHRKMVERTRPVLKLLFLPKKSLLLEVTLNKMQWKLSKNKL